ncbi:hypothetical protein ACHWQZ_G004904 [Mnemiopsis leidyi]
MKTRDPPEKEVSGKQADVSKDKLSSQPYITHIPENLNMSHHFSSLLLSCDPVATVLEVTSLSTLSVVSWLYRVQVQGSMSLLELAIGMWVLGVVRRLYNNYLEAVYCTFPLYRTQPIKEHMLRGERDLVGRDREQLAAIVTQDRLTFISQFSLDLFVYFSLPGFYPAHTITTTSALRRVIQLVLNHYVMSFGMYWTHRALHKNLWLWRNIHSVHHWSKHPLSRTTYQDHWLDNFGNAIVGHIFAQILVPLDAQMFWVSRVLRVCESLEKHSGVSGYFNLVHSVQRWLPFAQMPHHHDWHHEGHKGCNYTFSSLGGLWDCVFGTRKTGRAARGVQTVWDEMEQGRYSFDTKYFDGIYTCFIPLFALSGVVVNSLQCSLEGRTKVRRRRIKGAGCRKHQHFGKSQISNTQEEVSVP